MKLSLKIKNWLRKENRFFTKYVGLGEDTFTNGEVLATLIGTSVGFPVISNIVYLLETL